MDTQEILFKLEQVKEKEKDKQYFTGELNVYAMLCDVISFINQQDNDIQRLTQSIKTVGDRYRTLDRKYAKLCKGNYYLKNERDNVLENNKYLREYIKAHEHSELVDKLSEMEGTINSLDYELNDIYHPQPFKFEDFKIGLWVYDIQSECEEFTFFKITKILSESDCEYLYHDRKKKVFFDNITGHAREFEDGRFFPVTKALEYQWKEDEND